MGVHAVRSTCDQGAKILSLFDCQQGNIIRLHNTNLIHLIGQSFTQHRQYASEYEALRDYAQTLEDPLYQGVHRQNTKNYREATRALRGRYATDPEYDRKLNQLIDTYQLTKYDNQVNTSNERANPVPMTDRKEESEAMPIVAKHPVQARKNDVNIPQYVPLLGGIGTAGMIEMFRRLLKKRKEHD